MKTIFQSKQELRKLFIRRRGTLTPWERLRADAAILRLLLALPEYAAADTIMTYLSFYGEVDTFGIAMDVLENGKRLIIPKVQSSSRSLIPCQIHNLDDDLEPGDYGILEPIRNNIHPIAIDSIGFHVIPGVAFDTGGYRLGHGGGYYDRFLAEITPDALTVGLCYECQITDVLPHDPWDVPVKCIVTETRIIRF